MSATKMGNFCNDKKNNGIRQNFKTSTKTSSPTRVSGASSLLPMSDSFLYVETNSNMHGNNAFVSFERTDIIQISNITFYHNRFSVSTNDSSKTLGKFIYQLLLEDTT